MYGSLGAGAEDAVGDVGKIAEIAQTLLHPAHAQAAGAAGLGDIGVIGGELSGEYDTLQLGVRSAGDRQLQIVLQQAHGILRARTIDAVHVVVVVFQVVQRLLYGANGVAAAAAGQRRVLLRGLEHIPGSLLAVDRAFVNQLQNRLGCLGVALELDEREIRLGRLFLQLGVHVQLSAHAFDAKTCGLIACGQPVAGEVAVALED